MTNLFVTGAAWVQRVLLAPPSLVIRPLVTKVRQIPQSALGKGVSKTLAIGEALVIVDMFVGEDDLLPDVVENVLLVTSSFSFGKMLAKGARRRVAKVGNVSPGERLSTNANINGRVADNISGLTERASQFFRKIPLMTFTNSVAQKAWKGKLIASDFIKSGDALIASQRFLKTYSLRTKTWFVSSEKGELLFSYSKEGLRILKTPQFQGFTVTAGTLAGAGFLFPDEETLTENGLPDDLEDFVSDLLSSYAAIIYPGVLSEQLGARVSSNYGAKLYQLLDDPSHYIKVGMLQGYSEAYCTTLLREDFKELEDLHSGKGVVNFVKSMDSKLVPTNDEDDSQSSGFERWFDELFSSEEATIKPLSTKIQVPSSEEVVEFRRRGII